MSKAGGGYYAGVPGWAPGLSNGDYNIWQDPGDHNPFSGRVIGRAQTPGDAWEWQCVERGKVGAEDFANASRGSWAKAPYCVAWPGPNEPKADTKAQADLLVAFYRYLAPIAHSVGVKILGGVFSEGRADENILDNYVPLGEICDGLAFHEYGKKAGLMAPVDMTWHAFRFPRLMDLIHKAGFNPPVHITELGPLDDNGGWLSVGMSEASYVSQVSAYMAKLQTYPYVLSAQLFAVTAYGFGSFIVNEGVMKGIQSMNNGLPFSVEAPPLVRPVQPPIIPPTLQPFSWPKLLWPVKDGAGVVTQLFAANPAYYATLGSPGGHNGLDIGMAGYSAANPPALVATIPGECWPYWDNLYGWMVEVWYPNLPGGKVAPVLKTLQAHQIAQPPVAYGQKVQPGDIIGHMGSTGNSTGPHVHFGVKLLKGGAINPPFGKGCCVDPRALL